MKTSHQKASIRMAAAIAALLIFAAVFALGWFSRYWALDGRTRSLLWAVDTAKDRFYKEVDEDALWEGFYSAFRLDPYSAYYPKVEYEEVQSSNAGNRAGIGVSVTELGGQPVLYTVAGNSPAEHAGLRVGMTVYGVGATEETVQGGTASEIASQLGSSPADVPLYVRCGFSAEDAALYEIVPGAYRTCYCLYADSDGAVRFDPADLTAFSVPFEELPLSENTAYVRLTSFHGTAAEEFAACLARMRDAGKSDLILDLRANGGGSIDICARICSMLIKDAEGENPVVITARYRDGSHLDFTAPGNTYHAYFNETSRIRILADYGTASASECLIGAMVSYGTVTADDIYIRETNGVARTYGKGIMQSYFTDPQGNRLKLTVAEIFWPNGETIHQKGVLAADEAHAIESDGIPREHDGFLAEFFARQS